MRAVVESNFPRATWDRIGVVDGDEEAIQRHIDAVLALPFLDVERIRARRFHVALDCVRGAGGLFMPRLLEALGCRVDAINLLTCIIDNQDAEQRRGIRNRPDVSTRSTSSPTATFRASRNRSRRISVSSKRW